MPPSKSTARTINTSASAGGPFKAPAPLVAIAGWLIPGAGYLLIGQKVRGIVIGVTIICLFLMGMLIAGIRVIDVPGYDDQGRATYVRLEQTREGNRREAKGTNPAPGGS